jgi:hypothetical protein
VSGTRLRPIGVLSLTGLLLVYAVRGQTIPIRLPGRDVVVIELLYLPLQVSKNLGDGAGFDFLRGGLATELGFRPFGLFLPYGHQQNKEDEPERGSGGDQDSGAADLSGWKQPFWIGRNNGIGVAHYIFWLRVMEKNCPGLLLGTFSIETR